MIKKIIISLVLLAIALFTLSCQNKGSVGNYSSKTDRIDIIKNPLLKENSVNSKNNILVVYFSVNDTVSADANIIKDYLFADLMELAPAKPYTKDDLDINNPNSRIVKEANDDTIRPEIVNSIKDIKKYKWIFLGFPVWLDKMPKIVNTFLEKYDFEDKYIFTFCKANTDNLDNIRNDISDAVKKGNPFIYPPKSIPDGELVENITSWVDWCNPTVEYDEGLLPEEVATTEFVEPDLSEALSITR